MAVELAHMLTGLFLGLLIMAFHRPIADFMLRQERALDVLFRSHGVRLPPPPSETTAHNIYFVLGITLSVLQLARLWLTLQ
jgi:hypothetical protein